MWTWWLLDLCHGQGVVTVVVAAAAATTAVATATRYIYIYIGSRVALHVALRSLRIDSLVVGCGFVDEFGFKTFSPRALWRCRDSKSRRGKEGCSVSSPRSRVRVIETSNIFYLNLNQPNANASGSGQNKNMMMLNQFTQLLCLCHYHCLIKCSYFLNLYGYYIILLVGKDLVVVGYDSSCEFVNDACSTSTRSGTFVRTSTLYCQLSCACVDGKVGVVDSKNTTYKPSKKLDHPELLPGRPRFRCIDYCEAPGIDIEKAASQFHQGSSHTRFGFGRTGSLSNLVQRATMLKLLILRSSGSGSTIDGEGLQVVTRFS
eukprot:scaffold10435_cov134-Skeletonema_marinoi.AAC.1